MNTVATPEGIERVREAAARAEETEPAEPAEPSEEELEDETPTEAETEAEELGGEGFEAPGGELGEAEPSVKQLRALDAEQRRHFGRLGTIMGGFVAGFEECEHCAGMGLVPPGPKPQTHEFFRACETCAGYGAVLTGSRREGFGERDCPACAGRGYLERLDEHGAPLAGDGAGAGRGSSSSAAAELEPAGENGGQAEPVERFGVPAWMGDPSIGRH